MSLPTQLLLVRRFRSLSLIARLCLALTFVYVFGAAVGVTGIGSLAFVRLTTDRLYDNDLGGALVAEQAQSAIAETARAQLSLTAATSGEEREVAKQEMLNGMKTLDALLADARLATNSVVADARSEHKKAKEMAIAYIELMLSRSMPSSSTPLYPWMAISLWSNCNASRKRSGSSKTSNWHRRRLRWLLRRRKAQPNSSC